MFDLESVTRTVGYRRNLTVQPAEHRDTHERFNLYTAEIAYRECGHSYVHHQWSMEPLPLVGQRSPCAHCIEAALSSMKRQGAI